MSKLTPKYFKGMKMKTINNYIDTINTDLGEKLPLGASFNGAAKTLRDYLNSHDFINHEGIEINDDTIDDFITRINSENKNDNLNFLPTNKIDNEMTQEQETTNPLAQLVQDTITGNDLLQIYNRYSPNPITEEELQQSAHGDVNLAKAHLINQILSRARDGTLVSRGNTFGRPVVKHHFIINMRWCKLSHSLRWYSKICHLWNLWIKWWWLCLWCIVF